MNSNIEEIKQKLQNELEKLQHEYKNELPQQIAEARELGDLKENAGYHAARERMGFVKAKIGQICEQLEKLSNIDVESIPEDSIGYGSTVILQDLDDEDNKQTLTFVSQEEIDPVQGKITLATPYGQALSGKKVGDTVEVIIPAGQKNFKINYLSTIHGTEFGEKD